MIYFFSFMTEHFSTYERFSKKKKKFLFFDLSSNVLKVMKNIKKNIFSEFFVYNLMKIGVFSTIK
jgi:hypothetical protein